MGSQPIEREAVLDTLLSEKYRLLRLLGSGAYGRVYEAEHVLLGRHCAIKLLHHNGASSPRSRQRFTREATVLGRLEHENIVSLLDAAEDPKAGQYLVLEFIRGTTLRSALPSMKGDSPQRVFDIVRQLARGLAHAHAAGVVHRDLKPENVMLTTHADGRVLVKILDFGIARLFEADQEHLTATGTALGTAAYMAPEQARGDRDVDGRADVYALGVIVYEALCGARPFEGASYNETIFRILNDEHVPLAKQRPDLSNAFCEAVERALRRERNQRFAGAEEFARALCDADAANLTLELGTDESGSGGGAAGISRSGSRDISQSEQRPIGRGRSARDLLLGIALGFLLGAGFQGLRRSAPPYAAATKKPGPSAQAPTAREPLAQEGAPGRSADERATPPALATSDGGVAAKPTQPRAPHQGVTVRARPTPAGVPSLRRDRGF